MLSLADLGVTDLNAVLFEAHGDSGVFERTYAFLAERARAGSGVPSGP